jgi:uncharacterized protein (DUF4415 family)
MKKKLSPEMTDNENPEWTEADFKNARSASEVLPNDLMEVLPKRKPGQRGRQRSPKKELISIRLQADIVEFFRAQGPGWQARIDSALKEWVREHRT